MDELYIVNLDWVHTQETCAATSHKLGTRRLRKSVSFWLFNFVFSFLGVNKTNQFPENTQISLNNINHPYAHDVSILHFLTFSHFNCYRLKFYFLRNVYINELVCMIFGSFVEFVYSHIYIEREVYSVYTSRYRCIIKAWLYDLFMC